MDLNRKFNYELYCSDNIGLSNNGSDSEDSEKMSYKKIRSTKSLKNHSNAHLERDCGMKCAIFIELRSGGMVNNNNNNLFMELPTMRLISSISVTRNAMSAETFY
jgi:hypothetical protein